MPENALYRCEDCGLVQRRDSEDSRCAAFLTQSHAHAHPNGKGKLVDFRAPFKLTRRKESLLAEAAPDLLAACKSMLDTTGGSKRWHGYTHESLLLIEAAVEKAEGEPYEPQDPSSNPEDSLWP